MTDHEELFPPRTSALHEKLTAWVAAVQDQSPDELAAFMKRDPATPAEFLMQRLTRNGDGRMLTTTLIRWSRDTTTRKITFEFDTSDYEWAHGKAPKGYGSWAFDWEGTRRDPKPVWAPTSTYADAKRWVKEHIRLRAATANPEWNGHIHITVCS